jgi:hypothetical protein
MRKTRMKRGEDADEASSASSLLPPWPDRR